MGRHKAYAGRESGFYEDSVRPKRPEFGVAWLDGESERAMSDEEDRTEMGRRLEAAMREVLAHARGDEDLRERKIVTGEEFGRTREGLDEEE